MATAPLQGLLQALTAGVCGQMARLLAPAARLPVVLVAVACLPPSSQQCPRLCLRGCQCQCLRQ